MLKKIFLITLLMFSSLGTATQLHDAIMRHQNDLAKKFLEREVFDVNVLDKFGWPLLHVSLMSRNNDMTQFLLEIPGINLNACDRHRDTALHVAVTLEDIEAIKNLLAKGADVNARGPNDLTPLHYAAFRYNMEAIKQLIAAPQINVNALDKHGRTPLELAKSKYRSGFILMEISGEITKVKKRQEL